MQRNSSKFLNNNNSAVESLLDVLNQFEFERLGRSRIKIISNYHYKNCRIISMHPSVQNLLRENKKIIIPKEIYKCDVAPVISIDKNEVLNWYAQKLDYFSQLQINENATPNTAIKKRSGRKRKKLLTCTEKDCNENSMNKKLCLRSSQKQSQSITYKKVCAKSTTLQTNSKPKKRYGVIYSDSEDDAYEQNKNVSNGQELLPDFKNICDNFIQHEASAVFAPQKNFVIKQLNSDFNKSYKTTVIRNHYLQNEEFSSEYEYITAGERKMVQYLFNKHNVECSNLEKDSQDKVMVMKNNEIVLNGLAVEMENYNVPVRQYAHRTPAAEIISNGNSIQQSFDITSDLNFHKTIEFKDGQGYKLIKLHNNTVQSLRIVLPIDMQPQSLYTNLSSTLGIDNS